jgi:hypothetical protein
MRFHQLLMLTVGLMLAAGCREDRQGGKTGPEPDAKTTPAKAVARVRQLGGSIGRDEEKPDKPVLSVSLSGKNATDADLKQLACLTQLETLHLNRTKVTSAGLVHLKGLVSLRELRLDDTVVDDAGLAHLKALKTLRDLSLSRTKVTGTGLAHLHGLRELRRLELTGTWARLDDRAISDLQKAVEKLRPGGAPLRVRIVEKVP